MGIRRSILFDKCMLFLSKKLDINDIMYVLHNKLDNEGKTNIVTRIKDGTSITDIEVKVSKVNAEDIYK